MSLAIAAASGISAVLTPAQRVSFTRRYAIQKDAYANTRISTIRTRAGRFGILVAGMAAVVLMLRLYGLSFNVTDSMPIGLYHIERLRPPVARGMIVQACLPAAIATVGRRQGYLLAGSCSDGAAPVLKIVAATGGDRVQLLDRQVLVNGHALPGSGTVANDSHGRRLAHFARGTYTLAQGQLWFWTPNPASWDSRYYGPIPQEQVIGRASLLLALRSWDFAKAAR